MITTKINIKQHLAEYLIGKYNNFQTDKPIRLPDKLDLYHIIYDKLEPRPLNYKKDSGNLWICLPVTHGGKDVKYYNHIGLRSVVDIQRKIEALFWAELHHSLTEQKHIHGITYINAVNMFFRKYGITHISEDAVIKNYQRWRKKCRKLQNME